jgi:hypothetical protein
MSNIISQLEVMFESYFDLINFHMFLTLHVPNVEVGTSSNAHQGLKVVLHCLLTYIQALK